MKEIKTNTYKGTRILLGNEKRVLINRMIDILLLEGFQEIQIPNIQFQKTFSGKVGTENQHMMFTFKDRKERELCLAPEYTAVIQQLASTTFKQQKDVKLFYIQECFRGENPQAGRYRQFTQLGVEILNPKFTTINDIKVLAVKLLSSFLNFNQFEIYTNVTRGLDYYIEGKGFEITCEQLGSSKQICGGGAYNGGIGFAIGIDRIMLITNL